MRKKVMRGITAVVLSIGVAVSFTTVSSAEEATSGGLAISNSTVTPFGGGKVGGGTWEHNVWTHGFLNKYKSAYSKYWHKTKVHGSSAALGASTPVRDCVGKDKSSYAKMTKKTNATAYVNWNTSCSLK
ncbi:lactococcin 972 family bacteriocin [Priestia endophytica]|uniref:Lactococcin 972 family bacteriocin n=1 Tax=Priestia endophytica TaxID=135735 RepID=A0AAX1Q9Q1_9BACI|nr:lactococcin 972 family bacteriocin [Priestia endophytica]RAS78361.1 hypothetical protein A3864_08985 [Priestia endophytica]